METTLEHNESHVHNLGIVVRDSNDCLWHHYVD